MEEARAELARSVEKAGLLRDPYGALMAAQGEALALLPAFLQRMDVATERARQPLDPAALVRLEKAAATGADRRAAGLARTHNLRTVLVAAGVLAGSILATGAGCFWWGHASAVAAVHETEAGLADAFRAGPGAAAGWVNLMRLNDPLSALATCKGDRAFTDTTGAPACYVPLRTAPPPAGGGSKGAEVNWQLWALNGVHILA